MSPKSSLDDPPASIASSITETAPYKDDEKLDLDEESQEKLKATDAFENEKVREADSLLRKEAPEPAKSSTLVAVSWMVANTLATIGIVRVPRAVDNLAIGSARLLTAHT